MESNNRSIARTGFQWTTTLISMLSDIDALLTERDLPNITQSSILIYLNGSSSGVRIGSMSNDLCLRPNTTTASINKLESLGLVLRTKTGTDKRGIELNLTDQGRKTIDQITSLINSYFKDFPEVIETLSKKEEFAEAVGDTSNCATYCLIILEARRFILSLTYYARSFSMNLSSLRVLAHIGFTSKTQRMIDISSGLKMHQNVLSISANQLIKNDYVKRDTDTTDKRATLLTIQPKGRKALNKTIQYIASLIQESVLALDQTVPVSN